MKGVLKDKTYDFLHSFGNLPKQILYSIFFQVKNWGGEFLLILSTLLQKVNTKVQDKTNKHLSLKYSLP